MQEDQVKALTTELMLNWVLDYYLIHANDEGFTYTDDICLVDKGLIRASNFLVKIGLLENNGGDEPWEQILVPAKLTRLPKIEEAFFYFTWFGSFYGYIIHHPKEGFLVHKRVKNIFDKLTTLGYCEQRDSFFFWTDVALKQMPYLFNEDFFSEPTPDFKSAARTWGVIHNNSLF